MINQKIQQQIDQSIQNEQYKKFGTTIGTILTYDKHANTATVLITKAETDEAEEVIKNVPCPTNMGVQGVAPQPGWMCVVLFRNGNITQPLITNYYNHRFSEYDYGRQTNTKNNLPTYLLG